MDGWYYGLLEWIFVFHKDRSEEWVPSYSYQRRLWVEDWFQDKGRTIWVVSHAFWANQWTKNFHEVLKEFQGKFSIIFLHDFLIFSKTLEENSIHICKVFDKLREEKLLINLMKCSLINKKLVYLGFVVSTKGLKMEREKVKAILEWPNLMNVTKVIYFYGLESS